MTDPTSAVTPPPDPVGPSKVNLAGAVEVQAPLPHVSEVLTGKEKAGVRLTASVLALMGVFVVIMIAFAWVMETRRGDIWSSAVTTGVVSDTLANSATPHTSIDTITFRLVQEERESFREFWLRVMQMVLLNVLLPVLTALLGFVFGTHTQRRRDA